MESVPENFPVTVNLKFYPAEVCIPVADNKP